MKKKALEILIQILRILPVLIGIILLTALLVLELKIFATYGDKPVSEIPFWAIWLMFGVKK